MGDLSTDPTLTTGSGAGSNTGRDNPTPPGKEDDDSPSSSPPGADPDSK